MKSSALYVRTVVFGVIDSLVSTVGLLAGLAVSGAQPKTLVLTGVIYAFVEAFSMAIGNFLSEESTEEFETKGVVGTQTALGGGVLMFVVFVVAAFIPIAPYLFLSTWLALTSSIALSIISLFVLGAISGRFAKLPMLSRAIRMALLGGAAIVIGVLVGLFSPAL